MLQGYHVNIHLPFYIAASSGVHEVSAQSLLPLCNVVNVKKIKYLPHVKKK